MKQPISEVYHGDCMDFMRDLPGGYFDLVLADPEYGADDAIGLLNSNKHRAKRGKYKVFKNERPEIEFFEELFRVSKNWMVWGGNYFGLSGGAIVWNKFGTAFGEAEIAICSTHKSVRIFEYAWNGMIQQDMANKERRIHVTQKPIPLYKYLLTNYAKPGQKIFDPMMGSQSSRIAAWDMGYGV